LVAANSVGIFLASGRLLIQEDTVQDACQLATVEVLGMISMYLQWHRAAAINFERIAGSLLPEEGYLDG